jgi:serine/threonine-protein kinase
VSHDFGRLSRALANRYALESQRGAGAAAVVYGAIDLRHERKVAIKVLRHEIAESIGRDRFLSEIRILSALAHPNILPLYDSGEADGYLYYVTPSVGTSLRDVLSRHTFLSLDDTIRFATEIGDALDFAHTRGIVHRDIKPENILIEEGHAVVADFGIAKVIDAAPHGRVTGTRFAIGTAAYMSPEQGSGDARVDGRSDLYSLACVTYEMLAGTVPFGGATPEAIQARKTLEPMPSIRTVRPSIPAWLEQALSRGLSVVPTDRHASAREFTSALRVRGFVAGQKDGMSKRRWLIVAGACLAALGLAYVIAKSALQ